MTDLRDAAQQALEALETVFMPHHPAVIALRAALTEEALQRLTDANQEIEAVLEQPEQDWEDLYRKEKARADMWRGKYESLAGPDERVYPQHEQEPVACFIGTNGSAFDLPTTKRAYTYAEQPGNVASSKLGRALETARRCSAGDNIDAGLVLLKALQGEGFGVFQLGAEYTHPPRREWRGLTEEDIWTLAANCLDSVLGRLHFARAIEATLKERNHE